MAAIYNIDNSSLLSNLKRTDMSDNILQNINKKIGCNEFTINYIQGDDRTELKEGEIINLETKEDVLDFIEEIRDSRSDRIIVENVRGILYLSNTEASYWLHQNESNN